jgi:signal transduction histidine kinase
METTHNVITENIMILEDKKKIIALWFSAGMFLWFLDALLDLYYKYPTKTFIQCLLYDDPIHELFSRILLSTAAIVLGFVISGKIYLRKSRDELDLLVLKRTAELELANEELRQIPSRLICVQEEERKRLASELHDSIGQTLSALKLWVEMSLRLRDEGKDSAAFDRLEQFVPILQRSIEETRSIYMGLRPTMLDNVGLLATLEWLRHECMKLYPEHHIELDTGIAEGEIPENLKLNIFRIAQEALNNVAKHSQAEWVDISLSNNGGGIDLVVSDDGVGMNLDLVLQTTAARSLGLTSMRERAEFTGGSFSIESTPGQGTTITACWPIEGEDQFQKGSITLSNMRNTL